MNTSRPIRIVHILEATVGGTRRWLEDVMLGLDPEIIENACICSTRRDPEFGETIAKLREAGLRVWIIDMHRSIRPISDLLALVRIRKILASEKFDVVHAHSAKAGMLGRLAAKNLPATKVIYSPHAFAFQGRGAMKIVYRYLEILSRRWTDCLMAVSQDERDLALALGYPESAVRVILNGIAAESEGSTRKKIKQETIRVGIVADARPQKDPFTFVRACDILRRSGQDIQCVYCGGGPQLKAAQRLAQKLSLNGHLTFIDKTKNIRELLSQWDIFVLCSRYEGLPYALLEAMDAGLAVVATRVSGIREVIEHNQTGLLVPPADPVALADAIKQLATSPESTKRMGKNGRDRVAAKYNQDTQLTSLTTLYQNIASPSLQNA